MHKFRIKTKHSIKQTPSQTPPPTTYLRRLSSKQNKKRDLVTRSRPDPAVGHGLTAGCVCHDPRLGRHWQGEVSLRHSCREGESSTRQGKAATWLLWSLTCCEVGRREVSSSKRQQDMGLVAGEILLAR
jgi:hypothetical protein